MGSLLDSVTQMKMGYLLTVGFFLTYSPLQVL